MAKSHYSNADVGLRATRPFRLCLTQWDRAGNCTLPGDDLNAPIHSSRMLVVRSPGGLADEVVVHEHEFVEFVFIRQASDHWHVTDQGEKRIERGDVFFIMPGARHGYRPMRGLEKSDVFLQPEWWGDELRLLWTEEGLLRGLLASMLYGLEFQNGIWHVRLEEREVEACEQEFDTMLAEGLLPKPSLALFSGSFLKVMSIVNKAFARDGGETLFDLDPVVWRTTTVIEDIIVKGLGLQMDELAARVACSKRQLGRVFRKKTGKTLSQYYLRRRLQHAARILTVGQHMSITEIAHHLDFADTSHFIRAFKSYKNMTPSAYREKHYTLESMK